MSNESLKIPDRKTIMEQINSEMKELGISETGLSKLIEECSNQKYTISQASISRYLREEKMPNYDDVWWMLAALDYAKKGRESKSIKELRTPVESVKYVRQGDKLIKAIKIMRENGFTQVPVLDSQDRVIGIITDNAILRAIASRPNGINLSNWCKQLASMEINRGERRRGRKRYYEFENIIEPTTTDSSEEKFDMILTKLLYAYAIVLTDENGKLDGIITRADMLKLFEG